MELRHLQYFLVLAEERNFSRAASRLRIAQPSLSQQIRQLEAELDAQLFDRAVRPIRLTNAGQVLMADAYSLLSDAEATSREVRRAALGQVGRLRIGYSYGGLYDLVLSLLRSIRCQWPEVNMVIHQLPQREQVPALRTGHVDVVIGRVIEPLSDDIVVRPLREEKLIAILPAGHPLAGEETVMLASLRDEPFVMFPRRLEPIVFDNYTQACTGAGFTLRLEHEVSDAQTQALAIAAGFGVGLSGDHLALRFPELVYRAAEPDFPIATIAALWVQNRLPEVLDPFLKEL
ncbi:MAG: LysR substrate-binding domain-containing protein [Actinomycetota bacterium]|nr:LysR substrate-binding domain-containing protein [Actinomycetota bacterium]